MNLSLDGEKERSGLVELLEILHYGCVQHRQLNTTCNCHVSIKKRLSQVLHLGSIPALSNTVATSHMCHSTLEMWLAQMCISVDIKYRISKI